MLIQKRFKPDGFNFGINVGKTADQSVFNDHIYLTTNYKGDVKNPIGGVRGVIAGKQGY